MYKLGFLGCGKMGTAILKGLLDQQRLQADQILIAAKTSADQTAATYGVHIGTPLSVLTECKHIFVGVKPYHLPLLQQWGQQAQSCWASKSHHPLIMSMLAGTSIEQLRSAFGNTIPVIRLMPNLPLQVGKGVTLIYTAAQQENRESHLAYCQGLLTPLGHVEILEHEKDFHAATAISGCGPAYLFNIIEAFADAGVHQGLQRTVALRLAAHTVLGSGALAIEEHPAILKDKVTSPGGVTIEGVRVLEQAGLRSTMIEAVISASMRSKQIERSH